MQHVKRGKPDLEKLISHVSTINYFQSYVDSNVEDVYVCVYVGVLVESRKKGKRPLLVEAEDSSSRNDDKREHR